MPLKERKKLTLVKLMEEIGLIILVEILICIPMLMNFQQEPNGLINIS